MPRPVSEDVQELMRWIDRRHSENQLARSRILRDLFRQDGFKIARRHVRPWWSVWALKLCIASRVPQSRKRTTRFIPICCAVSRLVGPTRPERWMLLSPLAPGFVYLVALATWSTHRAWSRKVSTTIDIHFYLRAVKETILRYGTPETMSTGPCSQCHLTHLYRISEGPWHTDQHERQKQMVNIYIYIKIRLLEYL